MALRLAALLVPQTIASGDAVTDLADRPTGTTARSEIHAFSYEKPLYPADSRDGSA